MRNLIAFIEHRAGEIREVSYQVLSAADKLGRILEAELYAVIVCNKNFPIPADFPKRVDRLFVVQKEGVSDFDCGAATETLSAIINRDRPVAVLMGHTPWGLELAPALSIRAGLPLASDCVDIRVEGGRIKALRQLYGGKATVKVSFADGSGGCLITLRPGGVQEGISSHRKGEVIRTMMEERTSGPSARFLEYVDTAAGEVDISQAELLVSIGRGVGEKDRIEELKELAEALGGVLSCSRPVVDKGWLPKYHQVGTSGRSVKPKVYLALGISGAFQHVAGITGASTIIAVNKDKKAPIFRVAHYGVVDDLFSVADALKKALGK